MDSMARLLPLIITERRPSTMLEMTRRVPDMVNPITMLVLVISEAPGMRMSTRTLMMC